MESQSFVDIIWDSQISFTPALSFGLVALKVGVCIFVFILLDCQCLQFWRNPNKLSLNFLTWCVWLAQNKFVLAAPLVLPEPALHLRQECLDTLVVDPGPSLSPQVNIAMYVYWAIELHTIVKKALRPVASKTNYINTVHVYRNILLVVGLLLFLQGFRVPFLLSEASWTLDCLEAKQQQGWFRRSGVVRGNLSFILDSSTQQLAACWP